MRRFFLCYTTYMIPPENRILLIKNLKAGWNIRHACDRSHVSRSSLYQYYKKDPEFKALVQKTIHTFLERKDKATKLSARHVLMKDKQALRNRAK